MPTGRLACAASLLLAAGLCIALPAAAESGPELTERDFLAELPVVLSASRLVQPVSEAPGAVTVIDRETIRLSGARELAELFRLVPGMQVAYVNGANPTVAYHGLSGQYSRRMQVLVDGRSLYSPSFMGGVDWNHVAVALDDIERIEVVRGTNAALYGSNAFLGIANVITREAAEGRGVRVKLVGGNNGIFDNLLRVGGRVGEADLRVTVGRRKDSGFHGTADDHRLSHLLARADWRPSGKNDVQLQIGLTEGSTGDGILGEPGNPARTLGKASSFLLARLRHVESVDDEWSLLYTHTADLTSEHALLSGTIGMNVGGTPVAVGRLETDLDGHRHSYRDHLEFQRTLGLGSGMRLVWGAEARHEAVHSRLVFNTEALKSATTRRLFGNIEWRARPNLVVNAAAMLEDYSLTGTHAAPRLAVNWQIAPSHTLRAAVSQAYRTPSLVEEGVDLRFTPDRRIRLIDAGPVLNAQIEAALAAIEVRRFLSGGGLAPERIVASELGYVGELEAWNTVLDVRLFHERARELIDTSLWPSLVANRDRATIKGVEYQLRARPTPHTLVLLNQAFVRIDAQKPEMERSAPSRSTSLLLAHRFAGATELSLAHYWTDSILWAGNAAPAAKYRRLDLRLARSFAWGATRGEAAVTVQNQFDPYQEFNNQYLFSRRLFGTLALEF